jgi:drug/metabolite transporter (DMT)-like permease
MKYLSFQADFAATQLRGRLPKKVILYNRKAFIEPLFDKGSELEMAAHKPLQLKTYLMILVMVLAGPVGNVLLGMGMKAASPLTFWPPSQLIHSGLRVFTTLPIWLGILSLITFFVAYMLVLSWADYSFVQPVSSVAYGVVALLGWLVLGETVSPMRWAGIGVICLGVFVVSRTSAQTTGAQAISTLPAGNN